MPHSHSLTLHFSGGTAAGVRTTDKKGVPQKQHVLYSVAGALNPEFELDPRVLAIPSTRAEEATSFPSKVAISYGNASFLAMCMKLAYEDWLVVRDVVNNDWRNEERHQLQPNFLAGFSFHHMQSVGELGI